MLPGATALTSDSENAPLICNWPRSETVMNPPSLDVADDGELATDPAELPSPAAPAAPVAPFAPPELVLVLDALAADVAGGAPSTPLTVITVPRTGAVRVQSANACWAAATACCALFSAVWLGVAAPAPAPLALPPEPPPTALPPAALPPATVPLDFAPEEGAPPPVAAAPGVV